MRPIKVTYAPITASAAALNAQGFTSTGVATAPTTSTSTDGLAHLITLTAATQATLAGVNFTIRGLDANGQVLTETGIVGPASAATVTSTKHFKSVTSIQPDATMGGLTVSVGIGAESITPMIPLEWRSVAAAALTVQVTGTVNYSVTETYGSPFDTQVESLPWVSISALASKTTTLSSTATVGSQALRLMTNTVTNGATLTLYITQAAGYAL